MGKVVGRFFDTAGEPTALRLQAEAAAAAAAQREREKEAARSGGGAADVPCNVKWSKVEGGLQGGARAAGASASHPPVCAQRAQRAQRTNPPAAAPWLLGRLGAVHGNRLHPGRGLPLPPHASHPSFTPSTRSPPL